MGRNWQEDGQGRNVGWEAKIKCEGKDGRLVGDERKEIQCEEGRE